MTALNKKKTRSVKKGSNMFLTGFVRETFLTAKFSFRKSTRTSNKVFCCCFLFCFFKLFVLKLNKKTDSIQ